MLISTAYAQAPGAPLPAQGGDMQQQLMTTVLPMVLIFVVFYFLLIRPQQKKMKEHKSMLDALRRGDKVVTGGGIVGTVIKVGTDDDVTVEIAEGVRVRVMRGSITSVLSKSEPVKGDDK